jgi:hypothetical protein
VARRFLEGPVSTCQLLFAIEHQAVLGVLHERRFADELPGQVFLD